MRWVMLSSRALLGATAGVLLVACSAEAPRPGPDTLVIEVGGEHASLRAALLSAGVVIEPRRPAGAVPRPMAEVLGLRGQGDQRQRPTDGGEEPQPQPQPQPQPEPEPQHREVQLQDGETISHLASRHLGTVRRYREILELNGWTEAESRQLPIGTTVKLPPQ